MNPHLVVKIRFAVRLTLFAILQAATPTDPYLEWFKVAAPVIAAVIGVTGVALTAYYTIKRGFLDARYDYAAEILRFRIRQLEEFYAPMHLLIESSRILYDKLRWTIEQVKPEFDLDGFRLLDHMATFQKEPALEPVIKDILDTGERMYGLIATHAGLIEGGLAGAYVDYIAHFAILKSAGSLPVPPKAGEGWQKFVYYPRMLNREVIEGYKVVLEHLEGYTGAGDKIIAALLGQPVPETGKYRRQLMQNLYYYEDHVTAYARKFDGFDLSNTRSRFTEVIRARQLAHSGDGKVAALRILDVGCGTGRDAQEFLRDGIAITGIDASPAMLRECRKKVKNAKVQESNAAMRQAAEESVFLERTFDEIDYRGEFDGIWAAASLLHVPLGQFEQIFRLLVRAAKPGGSLFLSFKYGEGTSQYHARSYSYLSRRNVRSILARIGGTEELAVWLSEANGKDVGRVKQWLAWRCELVHRYDRSRWLNVMVRKRNA